MNFLKKHSIISSLILLILLTLLFMLGESSFKETVITTLETLPPQTQTAAVSDFNSNLVAHYTFDDTANDSAGSNHGTASGGPTYVEGKIGKAMQFDGVDDYLSVADSTSLSAGTITLSAWINPSSWRTDSGIIGRATSGNVGGFQLVQGSSGVITLWLRGESWKNISSSGWQTGVWSHLVATYDGSTMRIYRDGAQVSQSSSVSGPIHNPPSPNVRIGRHTSGAYYFPGTIDDLRIYDRALTVGEVGELYTAVTGTVPVSPTTTSGGTTNTGSGGTSTGGTSGNTDPNPPTNTDSTNQTTSTTVRSGNTVSAASCSQEHVQDALDAALDGDIVQIPSGTCTWTKTVTARLNNPARSVIIQGAGIGQTTIIDGVPTVNTSAVNLSVATKEGKSVRITGISFKSSPHVTTAGSGGIIQISGTSKNVRIDHVSFYIYDRRQVSIVFYDDVYGVIDHSNFDTNVQLVRIWHNAWGGVPYGDGSFAAPLSFGTEKAIYIENNTLKTYTVTDGYAGARFVVRYNTIDSEGIPIQNHGLDSTGRFRGTFSQEVYNNTFKLKGWNTMFHMRSGTAVYFNNAITMPVGTFINIGTINNYRNSQPSSPWGACDGSSPWDKNDGVVYASGTHTGLSGADKVLTSSGKGWTPNQWTGYSLRNKAKNWGSVIISNTADTITVKGPPGPAYPQHNWNQGDQFEILRTQICMDQPTRATSILLSGGQGNPQPVGWPQQSLEPVYAWNNTVNGAFFNVIDSSSHTIQKNRDFYENTPRPGYTPYTYPHPLTTSGFTGDDPSRPLPPPATPAPLTPQTPIDIVPVISPIQPITPLLGDFNSDNKVNSLDFSALSSKWNQSSPTHDLNKDGTVNSLDFSLMAQNWTG